MPISAEIFGGTDRWTRHGSLLRRLNLEEGEADDDEEIESREIGERGREEEIYDSNTEKRQLIAFIERDREVTERESKEYSGSALLIS
jgi:hypothetical protein